MENGPLVPVRLGYQSRLVNRDWASGTKTGLGSAMTGAKEGVRGGAAAPGEEHWSRFVLRTGTDASIFFIYLFELFYILGFCTQLESRCPAPLPLPLPLTGASVLSLFFASPPCSPPLTLRLLEATSMLPASCHRRLSSSLTRELSISH